MAGGCKGPQDFLRLSSVEVMKGLSLLPILGFAPGCLMAKGREGSRLTQRRMTSGEPCACGSCMCMLFEHVLANVCCGAALPACEHAWKCDWGHDVLSWTKGRSLSQHIPTCSACDAALFRD
eukprot:scaffold280993_cov15-Tisochrysis_lutea.AAC.1